MEKAQKQRLDDLLRRLVEEGDLPMASAIAYRGEEELYRGFAGWADLEARKPVQEDTIYRIFSMTKVITTVAMLTLWEEGRFHLDDPVSDYLPGFRGQCVLPADGGGRLEPVRRENTIRHLLSMTSGINYYHAGRTLSANRMHALYEELDASPHTGRPVGTVEAANRIGQIPLEFQPGEGFQYGLSIDVVGALVELLSGKRLGDYCRERIFEPLGLRDTGFYLPAEKQDRLSRFYKSEGQGRFADGTTRKDERQLSPPAFEEGGDGIVTTTREYATFARMLLGKGRLGSARILGRKTVEYMSRNQLTPQQQAMAWQKMPTMRGYGYGLGVRVCVDPAATDYPASLGEWGWYGKGSSWFCVDPAENLVVVFNTQDCGPGQLRHKSRFLTALYAALE